MRLTVAIPTYNRNEYLLRNLPSLLDQLTSDCDLLIVDNHSEEPAECALQDLFLQYPHVNIRVVRQTTNVGGGQNILRCIELCETEWVWLLGDDDGVCPGAVELILQDIQAHPDYAHINYCSPRFSRTAEFTARGVDDYVQKLDSYSNALFMSVGVYNRTALLPYLRYGYLYAYSWAPHFATLLASLGQEGTCLFSSKQLIVEMSQVPPEQQWSQIATLLGRSSLLDLPLSRPTRVLLAKKLAHKPAMEYVAVVLVTMGAKSKTTDETLYLYDQICSRLYYYDRSLSRRLRLWVYRLLVRFPHIGLSVIQLTFKLLKGTRFLGSNELNNIVITDRFARM